MGKDSLQPAPAPHPRAAAALAKLSLPRLAQGIPRPRLFAALDEAQSRPLVWIAAPAGAGKTTLAAGYVLERRLPYLWYQLDRDDADPATFFYYLGIAARQRLSGEEIHLPLLTAEYLPDLFGFARRYFHTLFARLPHGAVLVLDNFQDLGEAPLLEAILLNAIAEMPVHGNLLMLSREEPPRSLLEGTGSDRVALLSWDELRLRMDETAAIAAQSHGLDDRALRSLHRRADGWPAGVTLLLEQMQRSMGDATSLEGGSLDTIFQFFAREFFNHLPDATQDFLLTTAALVYMTSAMAEEVSGNANAPGILDDLHRRRFFIHRRDLEERSYYQYHVLFREFLMGKVRESYSREQYIALIRRAAEVLRQHARYEEAMSVLLCAQDWESAAPLLLESAPALIGQGRAQIVAGWLRQVPEAIVQRTPWLLYWQGMSGQSADPSSARASFEQAWEAFVIEQDITGKMLTASAIINLIYLTRQSAGSSIQWIDVLQKDLQSSDCLPSDMEASILTSLVAMTMFVRPDDKALPVNAERLVSLLNDMEPDQEAFAIGHLLYYYSLVAGDGRRYDGLIDQAAGLVASSALAPINRVFLRHMCVLPLLMSGEVAMAREIVRPAKDILRQNNLGFLSFIADFYEALVSLHSSNLVAAERRCVRMAALLAEERPFDMVWYRFAAAYLELLRGNYLDAYRHASVATEAAFAFGSPTLRLEMQSLVALCACECSRFDEALNCLKVVSGHGYGISSRLRFQSLAIEAYRSMLQGEEKRCRRALGQAMKLGREAGYFGNFFWSPRMMSRLCAEALEAGIEVSYAKELIRKRRLSPPDPVSQNWPWPVKIYSLGRFEVHRNGLALHNLQAAAKKPLILLQAVIALGGKRIKIESIAEYIWPDSEADASLSTFATTTARLRRLIGDEAILVQDGRVSLDERHCWLDVWALERWLGPGRQPATGLAKRWEEIEEVLKLYHGPFMPREESVWTTGLRRRLRERLAQWSQDRAANLRAAGQVEAAASLLDRLAAADPALAAE